MGYPEHLKDPPQGDSRDVAIQDKSPQSTVADKFRSEIKSLTPPINDDSQSFADSFKVVKEMAQGAADEFIHHPAHVFAEAIIGAGLGALTRYPNVGAGVVLAAIGTAATVEFYKTGGISDTVKTLTKSEPPDLQEKPEGPNENRERGAHYLDKGVQLASGFLAYKMLGRFGKSAGAAAMNEVSAAHSGEHVDAHSIEAMTKLAEKLRARRLANGDELKVQAGESIFKAPAQLPSIHDGPSFLLPRERPLPKISDGPQFDFLKSKE